MPTCTKCGEHFKNREEIDGKERVLNSRKHCLKCVPFGHHLIKPQEDNLCTCKYCGRKYVYKRHHGCTRSKCNSCMVNKRKTDLKRLAVEYRGGKCSRCGYNKCIGALTFHHLDPKEKKFGISGSHARSWESIKLELDKCILLCSNCHLELHHKERPAT